MNRTIEGQFSYLLYPKVREDLVVVPQMVRGTQTYMIKDPVTRAYHRIEETEHTVMTLMDGQNSFGQILEKFQEASGVQLETTQLEDFLKFLKGIDYLERPKVEKSILFYEKMKDRRKKKLHGGGGLKSLLDITYPAFDPDKLFDRVIKPLAFLWSKGFLVFSLICFSLAALIALSDWKAFWELTRGFYSFHGKGAFDFVIIYFLLFVIIGIHECAHGLTCKYYGGEVHELGLILYYFDVCFYCQVDDSYLFENKYHRIAVMVAGAYAELVVCSFALFVWWLTPPHIFIHQLSGYIVALTGLVAVVFNFNPLMKYDGYYILADYLEGVNLREDSFKYVGTWLKKKILKMPVEIEELPPRIKKIYAIYGTLAVLYTGLVLLVVFMLAKSLLVGYFHIWGIVALAVLAFLLLRKRAKKVWNGFRELGRRTGVFPYLKKHPIQSAAGFIVLFYILFIFRVEWRVTKGFVIVPKNKVEVRSFSNGVIREILINEGDHVARNQVLAIVRNDSLQARLVGLRSEVASISEGTRRAYLAGRAMPLRADQKEKLRLEAELEEVQRRIEGLKIRAPISGTVLTPKVTQKKGIYITSGEILCELADLSELHAKVLLTQWEVGDVKEESHAELKISTHANTLQGTVEQLSLLTEGSTTPVYEARLSTEDSKSGWKPGLTGKAKISCGNVSLVGYLSRRLARSIRTELWK